MSSWKPADLKLDVEYNKGLEGNQRCDLLFSSDDEVLAALELLASNQRKDILDHYDRVANYAAETGAREAWAVHFLAAESNTRETGSGDFPAPPSDVRAVHIVHDTDFKQLTMWTWQDQARQWRRQEITTSVSLSDPHNSS